jgi:ArsR family transcriptional regulator
MDNLDTAKYEARASIIKALAHPTRLFIVDQLNQQQMGVKELQDKIGADMSTVSKHLSILKNVGIVQSEKQGSQVIYKLHMPCAICFFDCAEEIIRKVMAEKIEIFEKQQ